MIEVRIPGDSNNNNEAGDKMATTTSEKEDESQKMLISPTPSTDSGRSSTSSSPPTRVIHFVHVMIVVCLHYLALCLKRLSDLLRLQAELNKRQAVTSTEAEKVVERVHNESFDSGIGGMMTRLEEEFFHHGANANHTSTPLRIRPKYHHVTTIDNNNDRKKKNQNRLSIASTPSDPLSLSIPSSETLSLLGTTTSDFLEDDQTIELLWGSVGETRIITTVFEVSGAGLGSLLDDLQQEIQMWFEEEGLLVVCSELIWSVPAGKRNTGSECRMKQDLFRALRGNNRAVLDLEFPKEKTDQPIILPESSTEEVSGREKELGCYQGVYRRFYSGLMPHRHREAELEHSPYWEFDRTVLKPHPEKFLLGTNRKIEELRKNALIALNLIVLKFDKD